jgi:hypothetical protein
VDLNYRFFYIIESNNIDNFMNNTGTGNIKNRSGKSFEEKRQSFFKKFPYMKKSIKESENYEDLEKKGSVYKNLEQVAKDLGKRKENYYKKYYSLFSRFSHTNPKVFYSYLNDFK